MLFLLPISKYYDKVELRRLTVCIPAPPKLHAKVINLGVVLINKWLSNELAV